MLKTYAQCLGLASLLLLENYDDLLAGGGNARMHVPFGLGSVACANIADIVLVSLVLFGLLATVRRRRVYPAVRILLVLAVPLYFLARAHSLIPSALETSWVIAATLLWTTTLVVLYFRSNIWYGRLLFLASRLAAAFAVFAVFSLVQLVWVASWKPGPHHTSASWSQTRQPPRQHARLVWIVFDELSYDQIFEHRQPGLNLPSFDALRSESTAYTHVQPIGLHTVSILPSLLAGKVVDDFRYRWDNHLDLHFTGERGWHSAGDNSVFGDAKRAGWRTAAVGWYNPYCTVYASSIDDCYWMNWDKIEGPMAQDQSRVRNTFTPLQQLALRVSSPAHASQSLCTYDVVQHLRTYLDLDAHTQTLLESDQADFIFLHLPVPHSPNIWNRRQAAYTTRCGSSYMDNLALADVELGKILLKLQGSPRWAHTTLIVQGDHSWRTQLWRSLPAWTAEDDKVSSATIDTRPAVLIHQPSQSTPRLESGSWSLLNVQNIVEAIIKQSP